jgi:hypothetical protein
MKAKKRKPYTSDLSDKEWDRIRPLVKADKHFGVKSRTKFSRREVLNAIFYVLRTGCQGGTYRTIFLGGLQFTCNLIVGKRKVYS